MPKSKKTDPRRAAGTKPGMKGIPTRTRKTGGRPKTTSKKMADAEITQPQAEPPVENPPDIDPPAAMPTPEP